MTTGQLTDLFLTASGVPEGKMESYRRKISRLLNDSVSLSDPEELLHFMHSRILKSYQRNQTRLDVLLDRGNYNCVSSAVLYMILTRHHGLNVKGIQTRDHAFCILPDANGGGGIDVETTSEWGFNPGEKKEFSSSFRNRTGFVYVPPANYRDRHLIGDKEMAGLILQNRIVELQGQGRHLEALPLGADRYVLTGSEQAAKDYYSTLQNAAALYNGQKKYSDAVALLDKAEQGLINLPESLFQTRSQIIYNACADYLNRNEISRAAELVNRRTESLSDTDRRNLNAQIRIRDLEVRAVAPFSLDLIEEIRRASADGVITKARAASLAAFHYSRTADELTKKKEYRQAYEFIRGVPSWVTGDREYQRILTMVRDNWAIDYHNRIVTLVNKGDREGARRLLDEALGYLPHSSILKDDRKKLGL